MKTGIKRSTESVFYKSNSECILCFRFVKLQPDQLYALKMEYGIKPMKQTYWKRELLGFHLKHLKKGNIISIKGIQLANS